MSKKQLSIKFHCDPGHGWACVKLAFAQEMGILEKVSSYSYVRGKSIYLEEDSDLSLLCEAMRAKGVDFMLIAKHTDKSHPIRSYESASKKNIMKLIS